MVLLIFLTLSLLIFLLLLFLHEHKVKKNKFLHLPPGPKGLPFIGNLHQLDNLAPHLCLWHLSKKYGPLMSLRLGSIQVLVISSAEMAEQVLKTHDLIFCSRPFLFGQKKLSYNGLDIAFAPYGSYWREIRKICIVHLLNSHAVQNFKPIRESEVSHMINKISQLANASKPINLSSAMMGLTSSVIFRVAFGRRLDEEKEEGSRFEELLKETQALFISFFVSDYFPFLGFIDKFTKLIYRLEKNFKELDVFYEDMIKEHVNPNRLKPQEEEKEDIVDVLLQILKDNSSQIHLTFDHIKAVLMNVFVAGIDTSAATVVWAMTLLMKNPLAMKKVQEEIRNFVGNKGFVNEEDIQNLPYMKAIIKETMRLQPTVPVLIPRESTQYCNINGYDIPPKTVVYVNVWAIGRDPDVWQNPEEFCPERFLGSSSIDLKGQDFELIPFGAGRRICPGIFMGLANVEIALANLLHKFDWEMPIGMKKEDLDMEARPGITMHKKSPLYLMPRKYM